AGRRAPHVLLATVPPPRGTRRPAPAATSAATGSVIGSDARSAVRTANPSIAEDAKAGTGPPLTTGAASVRPSASSRPTGSAGSTAAAPSTRRRASSTPISSRKRVQAAGGAHDVQEPPGATGPGSTWHPPQGEPSRAA